jgi:hypothetical protein
MFTNQVESKGSADTDMVDTDLPTIKEEPCCKDDMPANNDVVVNNLNSPVNYSPRSSCLENNNDIQSEPETQAYNTESTNIKDNTTKKTHECSLCNKMFLL